MININKEFAIAFMTIFSSIPFIMAFLYIYDNKKAQNDIIDKNNNKKTSQENDNPIVNEENNNRNI